MSNKDKKPQPLLRCPKCNSEELSTDEVYRDINTLVEHVECEDCGYGWKERYKLTLLEIEEV